MPNSRPVLFSLSLANRMTVPDNWALIQIRTSDGCSVRPGFRIVREYAAFGRVLLKAVSKSRLCLLFGLANKRASNGSGGFCNRLKVPHSIGGPRGIPFAVPPNSSSFSNVVECCRCAPFRRKLLQLVLQNFDITRRTDNCPIGGPTINSNPKSRSHK